MRKKGSKPKAKKVLPRYRIISFDGGGVRGILQAILMLRLTQRYPKILEGTDLFVGTSAGSFIALALAQGQDILEVVNFFSQENAKKIFSSPNTTPLRSPKYQNHDLKTLLRTVFPSNLRLSDLKHKVVVPAFRTVGPDGGPWEPVFYNNYNNSPTKDALVIDVALASSAAPIYFPSYKNNIDGGVMAKNPCLAGISFAVDTDGGNQNLNSLALLSIGTGFNDWKLTQDTRDWGIEKWLNPLPTTAQEPSFPLLSVFSDGVSEADTLFSSQLLNHRFYRLNLTLTDSIALDDYEDIPNLIKVANHHPIGKAVFFVKRYWG